MFGIDLMEHDQRYVYLEDWLRGVRRLWTEPGEFDENSKFFHMKKAIVAPSAFAEGRSADHECGAFTGRMRFSAKNSQIGLISPRGELRKSGGRR